MTPPRIRIGNKQEVKIVNGQFNKDDFIIYGNGDMIKNWVIIYSKNGRGRNNRDDQLADDLAYEIREYGKIMGVKIAEPEFAYFNPRNRNQTMNFIFENYVIPKNKKNLP